ncbi:MAG: hypothetical protein KJ623_00365 [Nanoarchaeota archaeon]|nr:hypothetical protein [Nanoarchaeota archaeon]
MKNKLLKYVGISALLFSLMTCSKEQKTKEEPKINESIYGQPVLVRIENSNRNECNIHTLLKDNPNPDGTIYVVIEDHKGEYHFGIGCQNALNLKRAREFIDDEINDKDNEGIFLDGFNENNILYINTIRIKDKPSLYFK